MSLHPDDTQTCIRSCLKQFSLQYECSVTEGHSICLACLRSAWFSPQDYKNKQSFYCFNNHHRKLSSFFVRKWEAKVCVSKAPVSDLSVGAEGESFSRPCRSQTLGSYHGLVSLPRAS